MKTTIRLRSESAHKSEECPPESYGGSDHEEEPPGKGSMSCDLEEEPPGRLKRLSDLEGEVQSKTSTGRSRFFGNIPDKCWKDWKWQFRNRITRVEQLAQFIPTTPEELSQLKLVTRRYPLSVTPYYLSLINPDDPEDPIRKQAIPSALEMTMGSIGKQDPLGEREDTVVPGLVHRYPDRVLMVLTDICPMFCRHCTRKREWQNGGWIRTPAEVKAMLDYISRHKAIRDVIVSGGDPLILSTPHLEDIIGRIRQIRHVEIIRIGTRFPVVLPQRIDDELCSMFSKYGPIWLNTHFNHVREITPEAAEACDRVLRSGIPVNNQSVLLRGVNDSVEAQTALCHGLLKIKVRPYYLFQCDEVQGTEHLRTPVEVGIRIIEGMRGHTSGLAIPTFVIDLPDGGGKVPLQPNYVLAQTEHELVLSNYEGRTFHYRNPTKPTQAEVVAGIPYAVGGRNASPPQVALPIAVNRASKCE
ncbi:MAG: KamA family radical SAM protein [Dehalococcoidia bacterium]